MSYAMRDLSGLEDGRFGHLDLEGIDVDSIEYVEKSASKMNVVLQWVQRLVVERSRCETIDVPAPILSRVFQEFSVGYKNVVDAKKLSVVPFPYHFAQVVWIMLVIFSVATVPWICASGTHMAKAAVYTFLIVFAFWAVHHTAVELEFPFDGDENDAPLEEILQYFNATLDVVGGAGAGDADRFRKVPGGRAPHAPVEARRGHHRTRPGP